MFAEAEQLYLQLIQSAPGLAAPRHMLGVIRAQQQRHAEALELIGSVLAEAPDDTLALSNYASALSALGRHQEALQCLDRALALQPSYPDALSNRGNALTGLGRFDEALASYDRAIAARPNFALAYKNRGDTCKAMGRIDAALTCYDAALAIDVRYFDAHYGRGVVLQMLGRYGDALEACDRALALEPAHAGVLNNRGGALRDLGHLEDALACFRGAAALEPSLAGPYYNQATSLLMMEDFAQGLPLYEWRKQPPMHVEARDYPQPLWTGREDIKDKTLLLYVEQGLGDAIHFWRYAPLIEARGARVLLSADTVLHRLLRSGSSTIGLVDLGATPPDFDFHIPLMSLPLALGTTRDSIPASKRYLAAERERVEYWARRIGGHGWRIGIAWQGNTAVQGSEGKTFPAAALKSIARIHGVRLINLQKNAGAEQLDCLPPGMAVEHYRGFDDGPDAFLDSAAMMENLDLVISSDTALAHLAGALGIETWLALKYVPEWRWFLRRNDSPWYPSLRLFRQKMPGDWTPVFAQMEAVLRERLAAV
jgi:tetratricopeptide (TPR) repeat protein